MRKFIFSQFSLAGRTSRRAFLRRWLKIIYLTLFLMIAGVFLASKGIWVAGYLAIALIAFVILANYAMIIRRFHDRGRSGWWLVVLLAAEMASYCVEALAKPYPLAFLVAALALLILNIWILIELFFRRGTRGTNRFGEDPAAVPA